MSDARENIITSIRTTLDKHSNQADREVAAQQRLSRHAANTVPQQGRQTGAELLAQFGRKLQEQGAEVTQVSSARAVLDTVRDFLSRHNLPSQLRLGTDDVLAGLPWHAFPMLERVLGAADANDLVAFSHAAAGASETGTLFMASGPENPTTLNFLPENHIILVRADDIAGAYEGAWRALLGSEEPRQMPRAVNLVSGPSRTADIEQTIILGAHGPKRLQVIIWDETATS